MPRELFCELAQAAEAVCSELTEDGGQHLCHLFGLSVAGDRKGVGGQRGLNFGVVKVNHSPVILDHVHLRRKDHPSSLKSPKSMHVIDTFEKRNSGLLYTTAHSPMSVYLLNSSNIVDSKLLQ